ncbi:hypothetical protein ACSBR1_015475 [Camellia fascicularis]
MFGRKFTWGNSQEGERWSRLDRFLVNPEWLYNFNFKVWGLPRRWSDHCPILLMEDERDWGLRPFKFLNAWTLHPSFMKVVEKCWSEPMLDGWAGFKCLKKLQALKVTLKKWNNDVFGNVEFKLKQIEEELHALDLLVEERALSSS